LNVEFIYEKECDWKRKRDSVVFTPKISPLLISNQVSTEIMISMLKDETLYGFALVDLISGESSQFFKELNWPPIIRKLKIEVNMLPEWMQSKVNPKSFPRENLVQTMNAEKVLVHTKLLAFYIKHGYTIKKLYKFYEFQGAPALSNVYSNVYEARVSATETGDDTKATATKLVSNSMYGQMLMVITTFKINI
jgi:hypothetical protein